MLKKVDWHEVIYQSSSFEYQTAEELESVFKGTKPGFVYTRVNNPTVQAFEQRLAYLGISRRKAEFGL